MPRRLLGHRTQGYENVQSASENQALVDDTQERDTGTDLTQEECEQYMMGFRLGVPLEGEPPATIPDANTASFQRGLQAGQSAFERAGRPSIRYDG